MRTALMIAAVTILTGCAHRDPFRENIQKLIDCEYRYAEHGDGLTCQQIMELQVGCYTLYQMRKPK
jgi:hypothetical protein